MPRPAKTARLIWQDTKFRPDGRKLSEAGWYIRDGDRRHRTGCGAGDREGAEKRLAEYIALKHRPSAAPGGIMQTPVADIINRWLKDVAAAKPTARDAARRAVTLIGFWGGRMAGEINGASCRDYARSRGAGAAARRELQDLGAALNHWRAEGEALEVPRVTLPPKGLPRERWLTRDEAARLLITAWRATQTWKGQPSARLIGRHVARFILVALYTGTRCGAICAAGFTRAPDRGWIDLDSGLFYRRGYAEAESKKRRPPVPLPARLLAHLRRWHRLGLAVNAPVEWNGRPVTEVKKAFRSIRARAGFGPDVTAHVLRHTTATWLMHAGVSIWDASGFVGITPETFARVYGHHHPDYMAAARDALSSRNGGTKAAGAKGVSQESAGNGQNRREQTKVA